MRELILVSNEHTGRHSQFNPISHTTLQFNHRVYIIHTLNRIVFKRKYCQEYCTCSVAKGIREDREQISIVLQIVYEPLKPRVPLQNIAELEVELEYRRIFQQFIVYPFGWLFSFYDFVLRSCILRLRDITVRINIDTFPVSGFIAGSSPPVYRVVRGCAMTCRVRVVTFPAPYPAFIEF